MHALEGAPLKRPVAPDAQAYARWACACGVAVGALGAFVLVAWLLGWVAPARLLPGAVTMKANTALGFLLSGGALALAAAGKAVPLRKALASAATLLGGATLAEYLGGWDFGIDQLIAQDEAAPIATSHPGRMSAATALCFVLLGAALLLLERGGRRPPAMVLALAVTAIGLVPCAAYLFGVRALDFGFEGATAMAVHTAGSFVVCGAALLLSRPQSWPTQRFVHPGPVSFLMRRMLAAVVLVPAFLGLLRILGEEAGLYRTPFGAALLVVASIVVLATLVYVLAGTARREEQAREAAEARFRNIVEATRDGVATLDAQGRIRYLNPRLEQMLASARTSMVGQPLSAWLPAQQPPAALDWLLPGTTGTELRRDLELLRADGKPLLARVTATSLTDAPTGEPRTLALFEDVTQERRMQALREHASRLEEQTRHAQEANRLKSEFLANMSHELRTPLNAIIGFAELLASNRVGELPAQHREYVQDIASSAHHLLSLINDVLDLSRIEAGHIDLHPERLSLRELLQDVTHTLAEQSMARHITVTTDLDPQLDTVRLDARRLRQVLYNYLSNALKFTPESGAVTVRALGAGPERLRLEVQDNGPGIAAHDLPRLFHDFAQLDMGSGKRHQGTGLGLALTRQIVAAQGGEVGVNSAPGQGSTFYAELPRHMPSDPHPSTAEPVLATGAGRPRVLVVEDQPQERALIAGTLAEAGFAVETVAGGKAALERLQARRFAAVTLDVMLPDTSGLSIAQSLREHPGPNAQTPVVFITIVRDDNLLAAFGVSGILHKPFAPADLVRTLREVGAGAGEVLVVDDSAADCARAREALGSLGMTVRCAADAREGLAAIATRPPDAVLLDLLMPGMDGFTFLDRLREWEKAEERAALPVIVWTVKELSEADLQRLRAHAQGVIRKGGSSTVGVVEELRRCFGNATVS